MQWIGSPNFTKGRGGNSVDTVVVHHMAGTLSATDAVFQDQNRDTSAHYGISRDGTVHQYISEDDTAYHAGDWKTNQVSIGIEHEDLGKDDFTDVEYQTSAALIRDICQRYDLPINSSTIRPHHDFTATACPGSLDIDHLINLANEGGDEMPIPDADNYFNRYRKAMQYIRGRDMSRDEFKKNFVGNTDLHMLEAMLDSSEADAQVDYANWGRTAKNDHWDQQIAGLQGQVKELNGRLSTAQAVNGDATKWQTLKVLVKNLIS